MMILSVQTAFFNTRTPAVVSLIIVAWYPFQCSGTDLIVASSALTRCMESLLEDSSSHILWNRLDDRHMCQSLDDCLFPRLYVVMFMNRRAKVKCLCSRGLKSCSKNMPFHSIRSADLRHYYVGNNHNLDWAGHDMLICPQRKTAVSNAMVHLSRRRRCAGSALTIGFKGSAGTETLAWSTPPHRHHWGTGDIWIALASLHSELIKKVSLSQNFPQERSFRQAWLHLTHAHSDARHAMLDPKVDVAWIFVGGKMGLPLTFKILFPDEYIDYIQRRRIPSQTAAKSEYHRIEDSLNLLATFHVPLNDAFHNNGKGYFC